MAEVEELSPGPVVTRPPLGEIEDEEDEEVRRDEDRNNHHVARP